MARKFGGLLLATLVLASAGTVSSVSSVVSVSSATSGAQGGSRVEATVTGPRAVIEVNGDRVEIREGRLRVNGVSYGAVDANATVTYRREGETRTLEVDGEPRHPVGE